MEENFMTEVLEMTPDIIVDDDLSNFEHEEREFDLSTFTLPPVVYPLTLSRDECLSLYKGSVYWHGRGKEYFEDTGKDYELVEQVNAHLWNDEIEQSVLSGGDCPVCEGNRRRRFIRRGTKTNFYFLYTEDCFCVMRKR